MANDDDNDDDDDADDDDDDDDDDVCVCVWGHRTPAEPQKNTNPCRPDRVAIAYPHTVHII